MISFFGAGPTWLNLLSRKSCSSGRKGRAYETSINWRSLFLSFSAPRSGLRDSWIAKNCWWAGSGQAIVYISSFCLLWLVFLQIISFAKSVGAGPTIVGPHISFFLIKPVFCCKEWGKGQNDFNKFGVFFLETSIKRQDPSEKLFSFTQETIFRTWL